MELGEIKADLLINLESAVRIEKVQIGRLERVLLGQFYLAVVQPVLVRGLFGPEQREVPDEHVVVQRARVEDVRGVVVYFFLFDQDPF